MPDVVPILVGALFPLMAAYSLGRLLLRNLAVPRAIALAVGAALLSHIVFALMLAGAVSVWVFVGLGIVLLAPMALARRTPAKARPAELSLHQWVLAAVFSVYGVFYLVHAMAPEIRADGYTYHLGLPAEWLRVGGFPGRVGFYEMLPQGLEMLFAFAFAFGRHSAAKLVHFAFLVMTVPLMFSIGQRLGLPRWSSATAAVLYVCAPVVGTSGTAAYNDAALVFFILATFYLLLAWDREHKDRLVVAAGLTAGFCYSIKFTGLVVAPLALVFVLCRRRWRAPLLLGVAAALMIAPWMVRNAMWAGNPIAPLFNQVFPNPHFHVSTEQYLAQSLRSYEGVTWANLPLELTVKGQRLQGSIGPLFLIAPLALLALRRKAGRAVVVAAALMAVPWLFNIGARFLMPSLALLALALAIALPRRLALACMVLHALSCLPPVAGLYEDTGAWRLRGFPWRAALRVEPEQDYLRRNLWEYRVAELVQQHVPEGGRVLDLMGAPSAYFDAVAISPWHCAAGDRMAYALQVASIVEKGVFCELRASWPEQPLTALRFHQTATDEQQWGVNDVRLYRGNDRILNAREWRLTARPNVWEAPFAFDRNLISRWGAWQPARPEMYLGVELGRPAPITGARLICLTHEHRGAIEFHGRSPDGEWRLLSRDPDVILRPALNLRRSAIRILRRENVAYILAPLSDEGYGPLGKVLVEKTADWGIEPLGNAGNVHLLKIR